MFRTASPIARLALPACLVLLLLGHAQAQEPRTGDLLMLRERALELVNDDRREHGLGTLTLSDTLNAAAQAHAEDMLARDYYAHVSPEGEEPFDRYMDAGGDEWQVVLENISTCSPCAGPPGVARVEELHEGWMESPRHRENILMPGITEFGFGIAAGDQGPLYAVQTFAGPGTARGEGDAESAPLPPEEAAEAFARELNERRAARSLPLLDVSPALASLAAGLLPESAAGDIDLAPEGGLMGALPREERDDWRGLSTLAGSCGGCGARVTEGDIDYFLDMWVDEPGRAGPLHDRAPDAIGFAIRAYGNGRKVAVAVLGERR